MRSEISYFLYSSKTFVNSRFLDRSTNQYINDSKVFFLVKLRTAEHFRYLFADSRKRNVHTGTVQGQKGTETDKVLSNDATI